MTKIQELAERAKNAARQPKSEARYRLICGIIDDLAAIAEAPEVVYGSDEHPEDLGEGYSDDVLIDWNGKREHFTVGWYDHDSKRWMFREEDTSLLDLEHMKWKRLQLVKYDKS